MNKLSIQNSIQLKSWSDTYTNSKFTENFLYTSSDWLIIGLFNNHEKHKSGHLVTEPNLDLIVPSDHNSTEHAGTHQLLCEGTTLDEGSELKEK